MKILKNKKGNWIDGIYIGAVIIVLAIISSVLFYFNYSLNEKLLDVDIIQNDSNTKTLLENHQSRLPYIFDFIVPIFLLGLIFFVGVSARKIFSTHILVPVMLFFGPLLVLLGMIIETIWDKFINTGNALSTLIVNNLLITNAIMNRFIYVMVLLVLIIGIALYTKDE